VLASIHNTIQQIWNEKSSNTDLQKVADELQALRLAMKKEATSLDQDRAVGEVAAAEEAARKGDGPTMLHKLAAAGSWAFDVATKIGVSIASAALKSQLGLS
jgi:hypothetical protein